MEVYSKAYLDGVVENQGVFFDYFNKRHPGCSTADFINAYMRSVTRHHIDCGQAYVCTMRGEDLLERFLSEDKYVPVPGETIFGFAPDWMGRFYAYYQWAQKLTSAETVEKVPVDFLRIAYRGLHDLDLDLAVKKVAGDQRQ